MSILYCPRCRVEFENGVNCPSCGGLVDMVFKCANPACRIAVFAGDIFAGPKDEFGRECTPSKDDRRPWLCGACSQPEHRSEKNSSSGRTQEPGQVCPACGTQNRPEVRFCENCGQSLVSAAAPQPVTVAVSQPQGIPCTNCRTLNRPGIRFCENCGNVLPEQSVAQPASRTCPSCGMPNRAGVSFCENCGEVLAQPTPQPVSGPPPVAQPKPAVVEQSADASAPAAGREVLRLHISREEAGFRAEFLDIPGKPSIPLALPFGSNWETIQTQLEDCESLKDAIPLQAMVGTQLFQAIVPSGASDADRKARQAFQQIWQAAWAEHKPLSVQLQFDADAVEPARMPWELLHDGTRHLAISEGMRLNRYITFFGDRGPFEPVDRLNILYVISRPTDEPPLLHYYGRDALVGALQELLQKGTFHITVLEKATLANLEAEVRSGNYHIVHFEGHGSFSTLEEQGHLCFETIGETTDLVSAAQLAKVLAGSSVRLVVLCACESGMVGGKSAFGSFGPALIRERIPAVVTMQYTVPFETTVTFAEEFYLSLAHGESIAGAAAKGRQAIYSLGQTASTWFYPALYLRVADGEGYLFSGEPPEHARLRQAELLELAQRWAQMAAWQQALYSEGGLLWKGQPFHEFIETSKPASPNSNARQADTATANHHVDTSEDHDQPQCQGLVEKVKKFLSGLHQLRVSCLGLGQPNPGQDSAIFGTQQDDERFQIFLKEMGKYNSSWKIDVQRFTWYAYPRWGAGEFRVVDKQSRNEWGFQFSAKDQLDRIEHWEKDLEGMRRGEKINADITFRDPQAQVGIGQNLSSESPGAAERLEKIICDYTKALAQLMGLPSVDS